MQPRLSHSFSCPSCKSNIVSRGIFGWLSEIALLAISISLYFIIHGNFKQALVIIPICLLVSYFRYRSVDLALVERRRSE